MSQALNNLLTLLNLEKIEEGLFRGDRSGRPSGALIPQLLFTPR